MKANQGLSTQVGVWVVAITILVVVGMGEFVGRVAQQQLQQEQGVLLETLATTMASRLQQNMQSRAKEVSLIAHLPDMVDPAVSLAHKQALLKQVRGIYPQFTFLGLTDQDGVILTDILDLLAGKNVAGRDWFVAGKEGLSFVDIHDAFLLGEHLPAPKYGDGLLRLVDISAPVIGADGQLIGVLGAHLSLDWAYEEQHRLLDSLDSRGVEILVFNTRDELLLSSEPWQQALLPKIQDLTQVAEPSVLVWPDGERYLAATARVGSGSGVTPLDWQVVVYKAADQAFAPAAALHRNILGYGSLFALLLALILVLLIRHKLKPLRDMASAAEQLRQGNMDVVIPAQQGHGDIARVSQSLASLVNEQQRQQQQLLQVVNHDRLTGLDNRYSLETKLEALVTRAQQQPSLTFSVLFIDLDNFKHVNDSDGHSAGDVVLKEVSQRFQRVLPNAADVTLIRWGGDEFVVLLPDVDQRTAVGIGERLLATLDTPFAIAQSRHYVSATIGIAMYPYSSDVAEELLRCADTAMYQAKEDGKNRIRMYCQDDDLALADRLVIERRLRSVLGHSESGLTLLYQPQFSMNGDRIIGAEALLRWHDAELGVVSPERFIPVAEQNQLIVTLGNFVIRKALADYQRMQALVDFSFTISINVSTQQLEQEGLLSTLEHWVDHYGVVRERVCLEITETALMTQQDKVSVLMEQARQLGYRISVDDFGSGHSSLQYLNTFKPHEIKVDRSFVQAIDHDEYSRNILIFTMSLANGLDLTPIAEGVENQAQLEALGAIGNFNIQGFLYAPPMSFADICRRLQQQDGIAKSPMALS